MPLLPEMKGFKFSVRIRDLTAADMLRITCPLCHKTYDVGTYQLHLRFPAYMPIQSIEDRMHCRACGNRHDMKWSIYRAFPPVTIIE